MNSVASTIYPLQSNRASDLTVSEAADALRVSAQTLGTWRRAGTGPAFRKIGGRYFYPLAAVEAYLADSLRRPGQDGGQS